MPTLPCAPRLTQYTEPLHSLYTGWLRIKYCRCAAICTEGSCIRELPHLLLATTDLKRRTYILSRLFVLWFFHLISCSGKRIRARTRLRNDEARARNTEGRWARYDIVEEQMQKIEKVEWTTCRRRSKTRAFVADSKTAVVNFSPMNFHISLDLYFSARAAFWD